MDYDACLICQNGADSHFRPTQKLTDQGYPALLYAITNRKDEISLRISLTPTQTFWKRIRSVLHGIAPSTLTAQLLTREKASIRNSKTLRSSTSQPVNYKEEYFIYGRAHTTKSDRSLLMIDVSLDKANDLGDEDMLYEICGCDNKTLVH